jgi:hypothetical protein
VLRKDSSSDYLIDLQPVFPFNFNIPAAFLFPHGLEWQSVTLNNKRVIAFQPEWSETDPGIQLSPSSSNLTSPDDLTVTYPFIEGLDIDHKNQPQPVSLQGKLEVIAPRRLYSFDLTKKDVGQTRTNDNLSVTLLKLTHNYAEIEFNNNAPLAPEIGETPLNPLIVQARDATGQFLTRSGQSTKPPRKSPSTNNSWQKCSSRRPGAKHSENSWTKNNAPLKSNKPTITRRCTSTGRSKPSKSACWIFPEPP